MLQSWVARAHWGDAIVWGFDELQGGDLEKMNPLVSD
jgi:hypothetical protein